MENEIEYPTGEKGHCDKIGGNWGNALDNKDIGCTGSNEWKGNINTCEKYGGNWECNKPYTGQDCCIRNKEHISCDKYGGQFSCETKEEGLECEKSEKHTECDNKKGVYYCETSSDSCKCVDTGKKETFTNINDNSYNFIFWIIIIFVVLYFLKRNR